MNLDTPYQLRLANELRESLEEQTISDGDAVFATYYCVVSEN